MFCTVHADVYNGLAQVIRGFSNSLSARSSVLHLSAGGSILGICSTMMKNVAGHMEACESRFCQGLAGWLDFA
jgi:hypothetical protein